MGLAADNKGLIAAYVLDGKGGGKSIGWNDINTWQHEQSVLWVHLDYRSEEAIKWLTTLSGLDEITTQLMTMDESRPRSIINEENILASLRGVNLNPGEDPEDMVSIRVWVDAHRIITTRRRPLLSIDDIRQAIHQNHGPKNPTEFLRLLCSRLVDRMADVIDALDEKMDALDEQVIVEESRLLRPKISEMRRQSIMIRRYLAPQREALSRLSLTESKFLSAVDKIYFREVADRAARCVESLDAGRDRLAITQEELASGLSEQLEHRMYILSVAAVIFLPLTFIIGLLGINVAGIPGSENPVGFYMVCLLMLVIFLMMLWIFHKKNWI
ncbi:MAG: zinc transporter ZntB [Gammaproteobacteria bacterium]